MNTIIGKEKFKNFRILLDSGCSSAILIVRLVVKLSAENDAPMQCHTQARNITNNLKFKSIFYLTCT